MFLEKNIVGKNFIVKVIGLVLCYVMIFGFPAAIWAQTNVKKTNKKPTKEEKSKPVTSKNIPLNLGKLPNSIKTQMRDDQIKGETFRGEPGITETVEQIMERERNTPKEVFDPNKVEIEVKHEKYRPNKIQPFEGANQSRFPISQNEDLLVNNLLPQTVGTSIAGPGRNADSIGSIPPDSVGDVGPTQVLMHANGRVKVYDKFTGAVGGLDVVDTTFWNSVRNGVGISDPRVEYDRLSGRWFLCMINVSNTSNRILIAVSSGPTITNTASFTFFQITTASLFLDYPTLGADANALYIGGNIFTSSVGSFDSTRGYVINKANLIGGTLTATVFNGLATGTGAGPITPQGVSNDDATFTEGYFIGVDNAAFSLLQMRRVSTPGGVPTISGNINVSTAPLTTTYPLGGFTGVGVPYQGVLAGRTLDDLDDRLFQAQITRDNITGVSRLWTSHNIEVTAAGVASTAGNRNGSRWYEITNLTGTPSINQQGTLFDSAAANMNSYWIPSVAVSGQGHMALGASSAGLARFPSLYAAGRFRTDTLGTTQTPTVIQTSTTTYNLEGANTKQRWGDYSKTSVDPCDNQSMWHIGEYSDAANSWRMRAVQLLAPAPPASPTPAPSSTGAGQASVNVVVTGVSVAGTEFYDNPAGFICNASCSTTGTGTCHIAAAVTASPLLVPLTINSVTFNSPTQVTLNLNTVGATAGTHTIQIRNPDGQATTFNLQILPVLASSAPLGGKIVNSQNQPIPNVTVSLADTQSGVTQTAQTNSTGDYVFDKTLVGQSYVATPSRQGFTFEPQSRVISHQEENLTVDFVGTSSVVSQNVFNDFDGDGKTDFAVFRPTERNWYIWQSQTNTMRVENWGLASDTLAPADFDGDGKTDLAVYRPSEGNWYIRRSSGGNPQTLKLGGKGDIPVAGDYDGDAKADIAVWRPKNGTWSIIQTSDNQTRQISWGTSGDRPIPRDFDGDGKVDPTVYRPSDGRWHLMYSANSGTNSIPFGVSSDAVTPADFDGDGKTDIAVYRGDAGAWFVQKSSDSNAEITLFGLNGDKTVAGDYDGDGRSDFALFRPSDSTWYVKQTNGGLIAFKWGASGDYPAIPGYLK